MKAYPFKLSYVAKTALWGGVKLKEQYGKPSSLDRVSETWELTCREKENSVIENGEYAGMTLASYFEKAGTAAVGEDFSGGRFPLLIKFIDACDTLSVQVHPDDAYALAEENDLGKTEMWYIVDAEEGAELIYGLKDGITREDFAMAVAKGDYLSGMRKITVKKGETYFIPSGMIHAIGKGLLIAEIQQNSDLTYRVYDFDRVGTDGKPRELHVAKALAVTRPFTAEEIDAVRYAARLEEEEDDPALLAACPYFAVYRYAMSDAPLIRATAESFVHLLCVDGEGSLSFEGEEYPVRKGDSWFFPAGMGEVTAKGSGTVLCSSALFPK